MRVLTRLILRATPLVPEPLAGVRDAFRRRARSPRRVRQGGNGEDATAVQQGLYTRLLEISINPG